MKRGIVENKDMVIYSELMAIYSELLDIFEHTDYYIAELEEALHECRAKRRIIFRKLQAFKKKIIMRKSDGSED